MKIFSEKQVLVHTMEKYLKLPLEHRERRVWWWPTKWYIAPFSLQHTLRSTEKSEWDKFEEYTKEHYPIQAWLREDVQYFFVYTVNRNLRELKWKIKHHIRNPRKEMRNAVFPPTYWDLQTHIVEFHIQCVIEYVEREKCFENNDWTWNENVIRIGKELKEAYEYCKTGRTKLQADIDQAWGRVPNDGPYDVVYKEVNEKEAWLNECDTKLCKWVIENREVLWV